ncbi:MAG TPA: glycosyltransferase [Candidatus Dormibacteraeota bacterium]|nr:glycosyltransferase [Candidatus Dormibacteraeota bacterium]
MSCTIDQIRRDIQLAPDCDTHNSLPSTLADFRGFHNGETILVCGCGTSLSQVVAPERYITIGVNDVGRMFQPDYLVVLNPKEQFHGDRFRFVEESRAKAVFTQLKLPIRHPHIVQIRLGKFGGVDFSDPNCLHHTRNSPYLAMCLAIHMGATRIGLIGVDFTNDHFFGQTGQHPLARQFVQIDQEYKRLYEACVHKGIELVNLSPQSRLTALPKMSPQQFARIGVAPGGVASCSGRKVFFVNYKFLSCGDVFRDGLSSAADDLGVRHEEAYWDDQALPDKVRQFSPDLLFVVHGRRFAQRWKNAFKGLRSAIWLLDEPYEVDDTARFSNLFDKVFINDPATLHRHRNAHYLPVCYDPEVYSYGPGEQRTYAVGFIGGYNPHREEGLVRLAQRGMLSYVVGGPWRNASVNALCKSNNIPARETAELYRRTQIVVNLFRSQHHFNKSGIAALALNPRVYEGLACGALVISEHRPELDTICPELPTFRTLEEMEFQIERHLRDPDLFTRVRRACIRRFAPHTYSRRLVTVMLKTMSEAEVNVPSLSFPVSTSAGETPNELLPGRFAPGFEKDWDSDMECVQAQADGSVLLQKAANGAPGTERGLTGKASYRNVSMEFEVFLRAHTTFIAKIHQPEARNHLANSYHLMCMGERAYLARHNHIFCHLTLPLESWIPICLSFVDGTIVVRKSGVDVARIQDHTLEAGYCFLGIKSGTAALRNIRIDASATKGAAQAGIEHILLRTPATSGAPKVSIITTVYDRVTCLERCFRSVKALNFKDYEHIVVADAPPAPVLRQVEEITTKHASDSRRLTLANLKVRKNDWGISPAAVGLALARGEYVCFLSDDNGYAPNHFEKLLAALNRDPKLGFVYSSCLYDGRVVLNSPVPGLGRIDLGQPLFRRELFERYFGNTLPFREPCWDWRMIESFMRHGVGWMHVNDSTFIFRLAKYPHLIPG